QWDTVMKWISTGTDMTGATIGEDGIIKDSTNWGDYSNSTYGTNAQAKNIFGLAGGNWEWTTEKNANGQVAYRGGVSTDRGDSSQAGYRGFKDGSTLDAVTTFRMVLYVTGDATAPVKQEVTEALPLPGTKFPSEVNAPILMQGMTAIKWDTAGNVIQTTADDSNWYNYTDVTANGATPNTSNWANAMSNDGSYWVWIPRYAYKITYYVDPLYTQPSANNAQTKNGKIDIKFLDGISYDATDGTKWADLSAQGYIVESAFTGNPAAGGWTTELPGFWMSKFEAGKDGSSKPGAISYQPNMGNNAFNIAATVSLNPNFGFDSTTTNSHMMKNTEWGAAAYLAHSQYGVNGQRIAPGLVDGNKGSSITGKDYIKSTSPSTTGNVTGVYDMAGGKDEAVAAYWSTALQANFGYNYPRISNIVSAPLQYKNVYTTRWDRYYTYNYTGDAMQETAQFTGGSYGVIGGWYGGSDIIAQLARGAAMSTDQRWGQGSIRDIFDITCNATYKSYYPYGFRTVLVPDASLFTPMDDSTQLLVNDGTSCVYVGPITNEALWSTTGQMPFTFLTSPNNDGIKTSPYATTGSNPTNTNDFVGGNIFNNLPVPAELKGQKGVYIHYSIPNAYSSYSYSGDITYYNTFSQGYSILIMNNYIVLTNDYPVMSVADADSGNQNLIGISSVIGWQKNGAASSNNIVTLQDGVLINGFPISITNNSVKSVFNAIFPSGYDLNYIGGTFGKLSNYLTTQFSATCF
ncbi:MAG: hypothetical protein FWF46_07335, partial [Oscillospiraceae bacterium]|nr:hypothetical protein [Oscillospiraceae bacterium]